MQLGEGMELIDETVVDLLDEFWSPLPDLVRSTAWGAIRRDLEPVQVLVFFNDPSTFLALRLYPVRLIVMHFST